MHLKEPRAARPARVILAESRHFGWAGLRAALQSQPTIEISGATPRHEEAIFLVQATQPDIIFLAADIVDASIVQFVSQLKEKSPTSNLIFVGDGLDQDLLYVLGRIPVAGFLEWRGLSPDVLSLTIDAVLQGLQVSSAPMVDGLVMLSRCRSGNERGAPLISDREQAVLEGLAVGLTEKRISAHEHLSVRTVQRVIARLEERFSTPNLFMLGMRAREFIIPRRVDLLETEYEERRTFERDK